MMSFCKNTLHAFLGTRPSPSPLPSSVNDDNRKPVTTAIKASPKKDSVSGSVEITSGGGGSAAAVGGLSSCMESLGFESSEQMEETIHDSPRTDAPIVRLKQRRGGAKSEKEKEKEKEKEEFPPVLPSLRGDGGGHYYPTSFLKPVRENGRLTLTPVTIDHKEVFLASRQDGRLRLQFTELEKQKQDEESEARIAQDPEPKIDALAAVSVGEASGLASASRSGSKRCYGPKSYRYRNRQQLWNQQQCVTSQ